MEFTCSCPGKKSCGVNHAEILPLALFQNSRNFVTIFPCHIQPCKSAVSITSLHDFFYQKFTWLAEIQNIATVSDVCFMLHCRIYIFMQDKICNTACFAFLECEISIILFQVSNRTAIVHAKQRWKRCLQKIKKLHQLRNYEGFLTREATNRSAR